MKVLLASAEAAPFAKVGGLADVVGSLPAALGRLGVDARVVIPGYGFIDHVEHQIEPLFSFDLRHRLGVNEVKVFCCRRDNTAFYLLQSPPYFGSEGEVYSRWDWDMERFIYFNQALMAFIAQLNSQTGWLPDVLHANDWHTSLLPFLIRDHGDDDSWGRLAAVISIHNIAYQGKDAGGFLWQAGMHGRHDPDLLELGLTDNLLGIGIAYSDMVSTVSPRYAEEIKYGYTGYELAPLIARRADRLRGILNGLDVASWDPAGDPNLVVNFSAEDFERKRPHNKRYLQSFSRLPVDVDIPLVGIVSRLAAQKGFDLALPALRNILARRDLQVVVLGAGEPDLEYAFWRLDQDFGDKASAFLQFEGALAQQIYAGCDIFLMPSHFEPCGMGQMMAMRYGALPLVRETGGLADTVENYDDGEADAGTGFVFQWQEREAVEGTLNWALDVYEEKPAAWRRMQGRAMRRDFSWTNSAGDYIELYEQACANLRA
ncbi:MAG: glycogen/starch synthase [Chloroflexi bacterium]|nr:glycogen/starch synthase [Chloroflexota bacterium]